METVSLPIYEPDNKFHITPNWIMVILFGITILLFYVFDNILLSKTFKELYLGGVVLIVVYFSFSSFFTYRPLNGSLKDEIEFGDDGIKLGNKLFEWKSINNLDFKFLNYYGKSSLGISGDFNPRLLQGVDNYVSFTDDASLNHLIYFRLETKNHYLELAPFINQAITLKKMDFKRGIDLVGIENVKI